jgi:hypothetical protein
MTGARTASAGFCADCGTALQGKFCSACGSPARGHAPAAEPNPTHDGWSGLTSEFVSSRGSNGLFSVVLSFLRHPVDTIIRLTDDPTYRSYWGFLTAMVGAQLTLVYVILPRVFSALFNMPNTSHSSAVITNEAVQYVGMAILTPIQYYVCLVLGTRPRSPMSYVELCVLSVSYGSILAIVVALIFFATGVTALKSGTNLDLGAIWQGLTLMSLAAILAFVSASHKRFWGMSWPVAIGVTLSIAALSWLVVYPALTALAERADIAATLSSIMG